MTTDQIREAFVGADKLGDRILQFHSDRVDLIVDKKAPPSLMNGEGTRARIVVHVVPLAFYASGDRLPLDEVPKLVPWLVNPDGIVRSAYNFEGKIIYGVSPVRTSHIQVFRNGILEFARAEVVFRDGHTFSLYPHEVECYMVHAIGQASEFFKVQDGLHGPYGLYMTLANVEGSRIPKPNVVIDALEEAEAHDIERDHLAFPDFLIDDADGDLPKALRPLFDILWQAGGWRRSHSYNDEGVHRDPYLRTHS